MCKRGLTAEAHGEIGTSPEEIGQATTSGQVAVPPADVGNGLLATNVGQASLVAVLEGLDITNLLELSLQKLNLLSSLGRVAALNVQLAAQLLDAGLVVLSLGHVVEQLSKESTFLRGDLGSRGVASNGAVTDGPDVAGSLNDEVLVHGKTAAGVLLGSNLGGKVLDDGADGVSGGPDKQAIGDLDTLLGTVGAGHLGLDSLVGDPLDHGLGLDVNLLLAEGVFGVVDESLGEHGENVGQGLNQGHLEARADVGDQLLDVLFEKVLELASELNASGATANDDHVHETVNLLGSLALEGGSLNAVHDLLADLLGVANLLEEAAVLPDAGDAKGCVLGADANDEHVVGDLRLGGGALDLRVIGNAHNLAIRVNGGGLGFVELGGGLFATENGADRLHDGAVLDGAGGT